MNVSINLKEKTYGTFLFKYLSPQEGQSTRSDSEQPHFCSRVPQRSGCLLSSGTLTKVLNDTPHALFHISDLQGTVTHEY